MKTTIVRLSVLSLAFAGFAASSVVSFSQQPAKGDMVKISCVGSPALCLPHDPTACGMH